MAAVTIRYVRRVQGHPEPGSQVTVERTDTIDALLDQGYAVRVLYASGPMRAPSGEVELTMAPADAQRILDVLNGE